jgi:hypothetical protein
VDATQRKIVYSLRDCVTSHPQGRTRQELSDEETFSYCGGHSHIHVPTRRRLAGPRHAEYRHTGDCRARTGGARHATDHGTRCTTDDGARRTTVNRTACRDDHDGEGHRNEEKEAGKKNVPTARDRKIYRKRYSPLALSQLGTETVPALYSIREIAKPLLRLGAARIFRGVLSEDSKLSFRRVTSLGPDHAQTITSSAMAIHPEAIALYRAKFTGAT